MLDLGNSFLASIERDVRCGYVTREQAQTSYGVGFAKDASIDASATVKRRAEMKKEGLPIDEPIAPTPLFPQQMDFEQPQRNEIPEKLTEEERVVFAMNCRCCS